MAENLEKNTQKNLPDQYETKGSGGNGRSKVAARTSGVSIVTALLLSVFKIVAGSLADSTAVVSDGIHSCADAVNSLIAFFGVFLSGRAADRSHPYGYERYECVISTIMAFILCASGIGVGIEGVERLVEIIGGNGENMTSPGIIAIVAAALSIIVNELLYHYIQSSAKKIQSSALRADAWHHRLDALVSVGSLVGALGARLGVQILDPLASLIICILILRTAVVIFLDAASKMVDKSCDEETVQDMTRSIQQIEGVERVDALRTRIFGPRIYVDVEVSADGEKKLKETHNIAENVQRTIEENYPQVKRCMVYMIP